MGREIKSSASKGTRKKHAAKKAGKEAEGDQQQPSKAKVTKGPDGKKLSKAQRKALPKVKQYIPPPKPPAPPIPDPLDAQGLSRTLPADLVVVLRRLGKKDDVTRRKGLDELREQWVARLGRKPVDNDDEIAQELAEVAVLAAIPVWLHNLASLLQSPFHRAAALALQDDMIAIPPLRGAILDALSMGYLPGTQDRDIIGSWLVAALEEGRRAGGQALKTWEKIARFGPKAAEHEGTGDDAQYTAHLDLMPHLSALAEYFSLSILDPETLHRDIHPNPVQSVYAQPTPQKGGAKGKQQAKVRPSPAPTPTPPPVEEDESVAEERWARYRVGGLVGFAWLVQQLPGAGLVAPTEEIAALLHNPVLWSALGPVSHLPDLTPIGTEPPIRRSAYNLLTKLVEAYPAEVEKPELLQLLSTTILGNCWSEKEAVVWEAAGHAIVKFLTKYPQSWLLSSANVESAAEAEADDDDEDEDEDDETEPPSRDDAATPAQELAAPSGAATPAAGLSQPSKAFDAFLEFISSISPTVPHLTYPLLVVVISTLPTTILPLTAGPGVALQNLFSHLWSPVDARLLSTHTLGAQPSAFQAFLQSAIDVTTFLLEKATNGGEHETAQWLVKGQLGSRVWGEGVAVMGAKGGRRGAPPVETEAKMTAKAVNRVVALSVGGTLTDPLLAEIKRTTLEASFPAEEDAKRPAFLSRATSALSELRTASPQIENAVDDIILQIADGCTERMFNLVGERSPAAVPQAEGLVGILTKRKDLFPPERVQVLSQGLQAHLPELVDTLSPQLLASLLDAVASASSTAEADSLRTALWKYVESDAVERPKRFALASGILGSGAAGLLSEKSLDAIAKEASRSVLQEEDSVALSIATAAVVSKGWLSDSARQDILASASTTVQDAVDGLLSEGTSAEIPAPSLAILAAYAKEHLDKLVSSQVTIHGIVAVHHLVILVPRLGLNTTVPSSAADIWKAAPGLDGKTKQVLSTAISTSLAELLGRVSCRVDPGTLVDVALATDLGVDPTPAEVAKAMLPSSTELLEHLARHTSQPPHPSLPVIDPLVPCVSETEEQVTRPSDFDASGRSRAARYAEAGLALLRADRSLVQAFPSLLHVALGAMVLAEDGIAIPGASRGLYTVDTPVSQLGQVIRDAEGALSFSLAIVDEAPLAWHKATVEQLRTGTVPDNADYLQRLLSDIRRDVVAKTSDVAPRIFREVLSRHLRQCDAGEAEGEVWLNYALQMSDRHPDIALAVILAIKPLMLDSKAFGMAQNRLANFLTGISVKQANEKGLPALRLLIASAPPLDSTSIFLPQQRAAFALRHVGGWLTSEDEAADDLADEVDVRVAELYTAVAPIVQDLAGAHWDAMFDLVEGTLTSSSLDDPVSYPLLYAGLNLLKEIRDLCQTNKSLRELWTAKDGHFGLVVNLFLQCRDANSIPVQLIHSLILDLLRDASPAVMAQAGLPELCDLLRLSSSATIQATAYRLLGQVIRKQTAALVLEVEADVAKEDEEAPQREIKIPQQLISIVEAGRAVDWFEMSDVEIVLGQLLAWMAVLDHFDDASRTVRWAYLDQINSSRLLEESLLPLLFAMLGVSELGAWNFPASQYAVDEFYPDLLEPEELADLTPLASHVFYRTLVTIPSAMRAYYESLKDRQLSLSLLAFTAKNYSPVIIQNEFAALREPRALAALTEEGLNVRIAQGGGASVAGSGAAEAIASYVVDEQPMEIGIRLPAEFPLKAVDVRDLRRVGVPENKWRGWLMSVQQTITSRNGLILEALTVFKKNVVLHFEGVVECAICYSIISLTDRTLPTKPCRTCKNRFHASCLFKWFNSSHSSSCPMCRSLF